MRRDKEQKKRKRERDRKSMKGGKKTSVPLIHVCVHSLRDNGCSPCDIEIASVKLSLRAGGSEEGRRVAGWQG